MERTIRVTGKGNISVKPDTIRLRISLEDIFREYDDALRHSADSVELLKDIFAGLGHTEKISKQKKIYGIISDIFLSRIIRTD